MTPSQACVDLIQSSEGLRLVAYRDPGGVWTIGWGHTGADVHEGRVITDDQAASYLLSDLTVAAGVVNRMVTVPLKQGQFDALVDFTYNLGGGNLAKSTLLKRLNAGDYAGAAAEFKRWNLVGDKVSEALVKRRATEEAMFTATMKKETKMAEGQNTAAVVNALSGVITQLAQSAATAPPVPTSTGTKPGYQTTEFWLTALLTAFTSVAPIFTPALGPYAPLVGAVAAAGYAISRGMAKAPVPVTPPASPPAQ